MSLKRALMGISLSLLVGGCGGGGGGGGSSSSHGIRVMHAAIDGAPVSLTGATTAASSSFGATQGYSAIPEGPSAFAVSEALSGIIGQVQFQNLAEDRRSVLVYEGSDGGFQVAVLEDHVPADLEGQSAVRIVNGASSVTVAIGGTSVDLPPGETSPYLIMPAGATSALVRGSDGSVLERQTLDLAPGEAYSLLVAGDQGFFVTTVLYKDS